MNFRILALAVLMTLSITGCASISMEQLASGEAPLVVGPSVRANKTPLDGAMSCYNRKLALSDNLAGKKLQIAVGEIKDYTGKASESEGAAITQGGSLMLFSGLYKLKDAVNIHDRFDMRVTDAELRYIGLKQLGDGQNHEVNGQTVPWMPYFGGSVKKSDYTILGGITELNYNIQSGGAEFRVSQIGPKARVYTMSVAADLRLVKTQTLEVVSAVSLQKQFTGFEVGFELFRFFGANGTDQLFDVNIGNKSQEPLQLGIRAIIEESVMHLIADATGVSPDSCMPETWTYSEEEKDNDEKQKISDMQRKGYDEEQKTRPVPLPASSGEMKVDDNKQNPALQR
ncbi:MAG: hypothetical protein JW943_16060 [Deltaproteobacteria bacterium]|nr:hypothetical protein [Deltaproteobacteria bacterium]